MSKDINSKIAELDAVIASHPTADAYYNRGKLYWRQGDKQRAISDFNHAVQADPESPALHYLNMANDVMDFYNTDFYNP